MFEGAFLAQSGKGSLGVMPAFKGMVDWKGHRPGPPLRTSREPTQEPLIAQQREDLEQRRCGGPGQGSCEEQEWSYFIILSVLTLVDLTYDVAWKSPGVEVGDGSGFWSWLLNLQQVHLGTSHLPAETPGFSSLRLRNPLMLRVRS